MPATDTRDLTSGGYVACPSCSALNHAFERACHDCGEPAPAQVERAAAEREGVAA